MSTYVGMKLVPRAAPPKREATPDVAPDYRSMSKTELAALCEGRGIHVSSRLTKTQLIGLLEA